MSGPGFAASMIAPPGGFIQAPSLELRQQEWIPTLLTKRTVTWAYLMSCFRGGMVFYNTALVSQDDMRQAWTEEKMHRRTLQFFFLGTTLAKILEIPNAADCLKTLNNVMLEYEAFGAAESRSKFIFSKARKTTADGMIFEESSEYSYLEVRNIPFSLDYTITAATLCDMVQELYDKLRSQFANEKFWSLATIDYFHKTDARLKKIVHTVYKEFETMARETMFHELNYLIDPMASVSSFTPRYDHDWEI
ncbi:hypothetical protein BGX33_008461 [Mortierella sp. NVP41]|nr:hypothetical protein BGX33_008461 [Mortierella sp. NVP41]